MSTFIDTKKISLEAVFLTMMQLLPGLARKPGQRTYNCMNKTMGSMRKIQQTSSKSLGSLLGDEPKSSKYNVDGRRTALSFPLQASISSAQKFAQDVIDDEDNCGLSIEQILALKEQFDAADLDGGGSLDLSEVDFFFLEQANLAAQNDILLLFLTVYRRLWLGH